MDLKHTVLQALVFHDLSRHNGGLADDLKKKNQALQAQVDSLQMQGTSAAPNLQHLQDENARLRNALAQRDQLLRSWQKHLNHVLGPVDDSE